MVELEFAILLSITLMCMALYKMKITMLVMTTSMIGMVISLISLGSGLPFTPWIQLLLILVMLSLFVLSVTKK